MAPLHERVWALLISVPVLLSMLGLAFYKLKKVEPAAWPFRMFLTGLIMLPTSYLAEQVSNCESLPDCVNDWGAIPLRVVFAAIVIGAIALIGKLWITQTK
jgi:hypothetical protein